MRLPLFERFYPINRDVEIADSAKLAVEPFQFVPYLVAELVMYHRRKKQDRSAQMCQRDAHLVQRRGISIAGRFMVGLKCIEVAPGDDAERGVAGHGAVQARMRKRTLPGWHRVGAGSGLA
jgi:hypothetical protein